MKRQKDTAEIAPPNRLIKRLSNTISVNERVELMKANPKSFELASLVQTAWEYWGASWEHHYGHTYYRTQDPDNRKVVPKDKKNLRTRIERVGFEEFIARMDRCFEMCDTMFPFFQRGKKVRPVTLDDFVSTYFFDQWITLEPPQLSRRPKTPEQKLQDALEKTKKRENVSETTTEG